MRVVHETTYNRRLCDLVFYVHVASLGLISNVYLPLIILVFGAVSRQ